MDSTSLVIRYPAGTETSRPRINETVYEAFMDTAKFNFEQEMQPHRTETMRNINLHRTKLIQLHHEVDAWFVTFENLAREIRNHEDEIRQLVEYENSFLAHKYQIFMELIGPVLRLKQTLDRKASLLHSGNLQRQTVHQG